MKTWVEVLEDVASESNDLADEKPPTYIVETRSVDDHGTAAVWVERWRGWGGTSALAEARRQFRGWRRQQWIEVQIRVEAL